MDFGKRQIGNTVILKYKKGDLPFIKVSTVSGDFSVEYGAGSVMFMLLDNAPIEDKVDNLPMLIIRNTQYVANCIDAELQVDVLKAVGNALDRADAKPISDEEDAKIIEEERQMYEMKKEMEKSRDFIPRLSFGQQGTRNSCCMKAADRNVQSCPPPLSRPS